HNGVIPNHQISQLMRVEHRWKASQRAWQVVCDDYGQTSHKGFRVAGDGAAIVGAKAAAMTGALAALGAAHALGKLNDEQLAESARATQRALDRQRSARAFIDCLYRAPDEVCLPSDDVVVCRCESVKALTIRQMADTGCTGPNQTKFFSRCGMGPCQGR